MNKRVIHINSSSNEPKYKQIVHSIINSIENKKLVKGDKIPSINEISNSFDVSRDTVIYAFNELKNRGLLISQPGKGYYIASVKTGLEKKIFLLFDELNTFKEDLYLSFIENIKQKAEVEIFFYHFNYRIFKNLILESVGNYSTYVIMPGTFENTNRLLSNLPKNKVYILDRLKKDLSNYSVIYQDFENDFYDALEEGKNLLKKYRKLIFVLSEDKEPTERVLGFKRFCKKHNFDYEIIKNINERRPSLYEAYFLTSDRDLVQLIKLSQLYDFKLGVNFGIASFNDAVLKEVAAGGITTISTDFKQMGEKLANMILENKKEQIRNMSQLIIRRSL